MKSWETWMNHIPGDWWDETCDTIQKFWVSSHVVGGATLYDPLVSNVMLKEFHVVRACIPWFHWRVESVIEITYPLCLLAIPGQKFHSFPSLKTLSKRVLRWTVLEQCSKNFSFRVSVFPGLIQQLWRGCVVTILEQCSRETLSRLQRQLSSLARFTSRCPRGCSRLISFESQSFLSQVFLTNFNGKIFSIFQDSSLGSEEWRGRRSSDWSLWVFSRRLPLNRLNHRHQEDYLPF